MTDISDKLRRRQAQTLARMDRSDLLVDSAAGYVLKHGSDVFDEVSVEDWIRADVEAWVEVSPSQRDGLIAAGVHMVRAAIKGDWVTADLTPRLP